MEYTGKEYNRAQEVIEQYVDRAIKIVKIFSERLPFWGEIDMDETTISICDNTVDVCFLLGWDYAIPHRFVRFPIEFMNLEDPKDQLPSIVQVVSDPSACASGAIRFKLEKKEQ